jgi:hypothetical protein
VYFCRLKILNHVTEKSYKESAEDGGKIKEEIQVYQGMQRACQ